MNDNNQSITFPIYRQLKNASVFYKIINPTRFQEIKKMGDKFLIIEIEANQFPEKLLIQDMIQKSENKYDDLAEDIFSDLENKAIKF